MPKVSIIVPVYNVEKYLRECLDSIYVQTFTDWECLLIDDGSPDNSGAICDEYVAKDRRFKIFHKPNGGVSSARNLGLENAKGEWVTFIDSDDLISPTFLEGLYRPIANGEKVDFVQGGNTNWEGGKPTSLNHSFQDYVGDEPAIVLERMVGLTFSKLFRLENVQTWSDGLPLRFDEGMKICEDMAFTLDYLISVKRFAFVEESGYYYRRDNETSALHLSAKIPDYTGSVYGYKHQTESSRRYLDKHKLKLTQFKTLHQHLAKTMILTTFYLFKLDIPYKERLKHYNEDWSEWDYNILKGYRLPGLRYVSLVLFRNKIYKLFDVYTSLLFIIWKIKSVSK